MKLEPRRHAQSNAGRWCYNWRTERGERFEERITADAGAMSGGTVSKITPGATGLRKPKGISALKLD